MPETVEITIRFPGEEGEVLDYTLFQQIMGMKEKIAKADMDSHVQRGRFKSYELVESYPDHPNRKFVFKYKVEP